jgi:hypothetical protein
LLRSCIRHWNRDRSRELDQLSNLSHSRRQLFANAAIAASRLRVAVGRLTRYAVGGGGGGFGGLGSGGFGGLGDGMGNSCALEQNSVDQSLETGAAPLANRAPNHVPAARAQGDFGGTRSAKGTW